MASHLNDTVFPEDLEDDDETQEEEEEDDDDDDVVLDQPPPTVLAAAPLSAASHALLHTSPIPADDSSPKRQRTEQFEEKKAAAADDSRRLFQRLWTDEDEIGLLQGFLEYTAQRGSSSHHNDTALFYDQIKSKLQLGFNKNQLVEKLRRLKKKYRNVLGKLHSGKEFSFKTPHDRATFEISRRIWTSTSTSTAPVAAHEDDDEINPNPNPYANPNSGHSARTRKRPRPRAEKRELNDRDDYCIGHDNSNNKDNENCYDGGSNVHAVIEETVRSCLTPVLKELVGSALGFGGRGFGAVNPPLPMPLNMGFGEVAMDDKWRKQHILELEVYSKRLGLLQDEIKVALQELRSPGGGG